MDSHCEGRCFAIVEMSSEIDECGQFVVSEVNERQIPTTNVVRHIYRFVTVSVVDCSYVERFSGGDAHHHEYRLVMARQFSKRNA